MAAPAPPPAFTADIDRPYLRPEFETVLTTTMQHALSTDASLGGPHPAARTRATWSRLRRRMCQVFPRGHARPRLLSAAFLSSERRGLSDHRRDVRATWAGAALPPGTDAVSGAPLRATWWQRYPWPPPPPPAHNAPVYLRAPPPPPPPRARGRKRARPRAWGGAPPRVVRARFVDLLPAGRARVRVGGALRTVRDEDVMSADAGGSGGVGVCVAPSPRSAVCVRRGGEYEVDVRAVAEALRVMEAKEGLLARLAGVNDAAERQGASGALRDAHRALMAGLADANARLDAVLPGLCPPAPEVAPGVAPALLDFGSSPARPACARPAAAVRAPRLAPVPGLRPEHLAKNVDFRTGAGAALLGKALVRKALAELPDDDRLKGAPAALRADVIECVSTCVGILVRARATGSGECVEELVDALRVKCAENAHLVAGIRDALGAFDDGRR